MARFRPSLPHELDGPSVKPTVATLNQYIDRISELETEIQELERRITMHDVAANCSVHGHDWDIIMRGTGVPIAITCSRCGQSYRIVT